MKNSQKFTFTSLVVILFIVSVISFVSSPTDSRERRRQTAKKVNFWVEQIKDGSKDSEALRELIEIATSDYSFGASYAAGTIGSLGEKAIPAVPVLVSLLNSQDQVVAREAAISLAQLGPLAVDHIEAIQIKALSGDPSLDVTWFCVEALGNMESRAMSMLPLLKSRAPTGVPQYEDARSRAIAKLEKNEDAR